MDDMCCQVISRNEHFEEAIVKVLKLWMNKDDVMVRVTYCLGNLFAKSDEMRIKVSHARLFMLIHHPIQPNSYTRVLEWTMIYAKVVNL